MRKILPMMPGEDSRSNEHARAVDQGVDAAEPVTMATFPVIGCCGPFGARNHRPFGKGFHDAERRAVLRSPPRGDFGGGSS